MTTAPYSEDPTMGMTPIEPVDSMEPIACHQPAKPPICQTATAGGGFWGIVTWPVFYLTIGLAKLTFNAQWEGDLYRGRADQASARYQYEQASNLYAKAGAAFRKVQQESAADNMRSRAFENQARWWMEQGGEKEVAGDIAGTRQVLGDAAKAFADAAASARAATDPKRGDALQREAGDIYLRLADRAAERGADATGVVADGRRALQHFLAAHAADRVAATFTHIDHLLSERAGGQGKKKAWSEAARTYGELADFYRDNNEMASARAARMQEAEAWVNDSDHNAGAGRITTAVTSSDHGAQLYEAVGDPSLAAEAWGWSGRLLLRQGNAYSEAADRFDKAGAAFRAAGMEPAAQAVDRDSGDALMHFGDRAAEGGNHAVAMEAYQNALYRFSAPADEDRRASAEEARAKAAAEDYVVQAEVLRRIDPGDGRLAMLYRMAGEVTQGHARNTHSESAYRKAAGQYEQVWTLLLEQETQLRKREATPKAWRELYERQLDVLMPLQECYTAARVAASGRGDMATEQALARAEGTIYRRMGGVREAQRRLAEVQDEGGDTTDGAGALAALRQRIERWHSGTEALRPIAEAIARQRHVPVGQVLVELVRGSGSHWQWLEGTVGVRAPSLARLRSGASELVGKGDRGYPHADPASDSDGTLVPRLDHVGGKGK